MEKNERWVIAIDNTKMDLDLLRYAKGLSEIFTPESISLITVMEDKRSNPYLPVEYFEFMNQVEEDLKLGMKSKVETVFGEGGISFDYHVGYGTPFEEIIQLVLNKSASLVIAGKKKVSTGSGVVSDRLTRNLPCDVLVVPEEKTCTISSVMISTDFSEHSLLALGRALKFTEVISKTSLVAFHGYKVPMGYSKSGKTYEEFAEVMRSLAHEKMTAWIKDLPVVADPVLGLFDSSLADLMMTTATKKSVDLIVIGSKGQTAASLALLGSNTMKLIAKNTTIPVLIVKKPGENMDIIQALRQL